MNARDLELLVEKIAAAQAAHEIRCAESKANLESMAKRPVEVSQILFSWKVMLTLLSATAVLAFGAGLGQFVALYISNGPLNEKIAAQQAALVKVTEDIQKIKNNQENQNQKAQDDGKAALLQAIQLAKQANDTMEKLYRMNEEQAAKVPPRR